MHLTYNQRACLLSSKAFEKMIRLYGDIKFGVYGFCFILEIQGESFSIIV